MRDIVIGSGVTRITDAAAAKISNLIVGFENLIGLELGKVVIDKNGIGFYKFYMRRGGYDWGLCTIGLILENGVVDYIGYDDENQIQDYTVYNQVRNAR